MCVFKWNFIFVLFCVFIFSFSAKSLRTSSNIFVINLAVCDFLMMSKIPILVYNSFHHGMALGPFWCEIYGLIGSLAGIGAAITNAFIAYDRCILLNIKSHWTENWTKLYYFCRYSVIANPMNGKMSMTKAIFSLILIWSYVLPWSLFPYLKLWGRFVAEGFLSTCSFDYLSDSFDNKFFVTVLFTFSYVIPMMLIIYYYCQICNHVLLHEQALKEQAQKMNIATLRSSSARASNTEIRIAKVAITICFLFVLGKSSKQFNSMTKTKYFRIFLCMPAWTPYR